MEGCKKYKVVVSFRARTMLGDHLRFLGRVSKAAAEAKRKAIMERLHTLEYMPERYPYLQGEPPIPAETFRRMFLEDWYLALYQIKGNTVCVSYILDCRQKFPWLLGEN